MKEVMKKTMLTAACAASICVMLAGCAAPTAAPSAAPSAPPKTAEAERYRCENDIAFTVRFSGDSAVVDSNRGYEVLHRDARGQTPSPTAYGNPRMRAEFGMGAAGNQAVLRYLLQPVVVRCARE